MMKAILSALFIALLMVGCSESDLSDPIVLQYVTADAVDWSKLEDRSGVTYLSNTDKPFSGYAKRVYENEQIEVLAYFKDGYVVRVKQWQDNGSARWDIGLIEGTVVIADMPLGEVFASEIIRSGGHGLWTAWHENGLKSMEANYKDGYSNGLWTAWDKNGKKRKETNYKDGKKDGLEIYYSEEGTENRRYTYKDGKRVN